MNNQKSNLRSRAADLFAAEARNQELVGLALMQQNDYLTLDTNTANCMTTHDNLEALVFNSDNRILNVAQGLQNARHYAAQLQAQDGQLLALQNRVYGKTQSDLGNEDIIDGEIINEDTVVDLTK